MAETKTKATPQSAADFIAAVPNPVRRADAEALTALMQRITGAPPVMWGPSIIGFGAYDYRYESGHGGSMCRIGFSPRSTSLVLYILATSDRQADILARLGKHKTGKGCLYINRLADVDMAVLEDLIAGGWAEMNERHPA